MKRSLVRYGGIGAAVLSLPLAIEVEVPQDSSLTQIRVAGGGGHYVGVMRDCDGEVLSKGEDEFYDVAVAVDHKFGGTPIFIGASGGLLHDGRFDEGNVSYYVCPTVGFGWTQFGISLGSVYLTEEFLDPNDYSPLYGESAPVWVPSLGLRIGRAGGFHYTSTILGAFPYYSGGGYVESGFGGAISPRTTLWGGVNFEGLTATGAMARVERRMSDRVYLNLGASLGAREGDTEYGGTIGLTYRVIH